MRCKFCRNKPIIKTTQGYLCKNHFIEYYYKFLEKAIKNFDMFKKKDKILVAISGGKDSSSLAFALKKLGYDISLYYIDLGIKNYSDKSLEAVKKLSKLLDTELFVDKLIDYKIVIKRVGKRSPCSICGLSKRYLMNKFAWENGFDVLATAHNLDDFLSFIFMNFVSGDLDQLFRLDVVLEGNKELKLVKKVKPLIFFGEKENLLFAKLNNLPIYHEKCPFSKNNTQNKWKLKIYKLFNDPNQKYQFLLNFLKMKKEWKKEKIDLKKCKICGFPTTSEICAFCRLQNFMIKNVFV